MGEDWYLDRYAEDQAELSASLPAAPGNDDPFGNHIDEGPCEDMDGDHRSALASAGFGDDEECYPEPLEGFGWYGEIGSREG